MIDFELPDGNRLRQWSVVAAGGLSVVLSFALLQDWQNRLGVRQDQAEEQLAHQYQLIGQSPSFEEALETINGSALAQRGMILAEIRSLAAAQLQSLVVDIVRRHSGLVKSAQITSLPEPEDGQILALDISFSVSAEALIDVISALETSVPVLALKQTRLRSAPRFGQEGDSHPVDIQVQTRIDALWARPEAETLS